MARILYIEDYPAAAMTMQFVLEELQHECVVAATGADAIKACADSRFDLVLIDNQLPDIEGPEVARAIRAQEKALGQEPAILVGFTAGTKGSDTYKDAGMDGFAMKSLSLNDVQALIDSYLKP